MMRRFALLPSVALVLAAVTLSACETTVDPFIEDDRFYTVFGYLDTATDLQAVRVIALGRVIGSTSGEIDGAVSSTEIETGVVTEWYPELITFADSSVGSVFRGPFRNHNNPDCHRNPDRRAARGNGRCLSAGVLV